MKKMIYCSFLTMVLLIGLSQKSNSQSWDWYQDPQVGFANRLQVMDQDFYNNYYLRGQYYDTIFFTDTAFYHPDNTHGTYEAIAKYNVNGEFIKAVDFYSLPNRILTYTNVQIDSESNIYVAGGFQDSLFCNELVLNHGGVPNTFVPDAYIVKLDNDLNIVWADIISGDLQENVLDIQITDDDRIFIATNHISGGIVDSENVFLGQDTTFHDFDFLSITRINSDKAIVWNREVEGKINGNMSIGEDGNVHFFGRSWSNIFIDQDTLFNPHGHDNPPESYCSFELIYNQEGELLKAQFIDNELYYFDGYFDIEGNLYTTAQIYDTVLFEGDTLYGYEGGPNFVLVKMNPQREVEWYKKFVAVDSYFHMGRIPILIQDDKLVFILSAVNDFYIDDLLISSEHPDKSIIGEINKLGELNWYLTVQSNQSVNISNFIFDNCGNILLNGAYSGDAYFQNNTLNMNSKDNVNLFFGKIIFKTPMTNFMGNDSAFCDSHLLTAPSNFQYYLWNDSLSQQSSILVNKSEMFQVAIGDEEGCWEYDTISIEIQDGFSFDLGSDTTILINDTIFINAPDDMEYDSYLWSNGASSEEMVIIGNQYGIGSFPIWLQLNSGVCMASDTIILTVEDGSWMSEYQKNFQVYPIPSDQQIFIKWEDWNSEQIRYEIIDIYGRHLMQGSVQKGVQKIDISILKKGNYFLKITEKNHTISVVKLIRK